MWSFLYWCIYCDLATRGVLSDVRQGTSWPCSGLILRNGTERKYKMILHVYVLCMI